MGVITGVVSLEAEANGGLLAMLQEAFPTTYYVSDAPELGTLVVNQTTGAWRYAADIGLPSSGLEDKFTITARNGVASTDYQGSVPLVETGTILSVSVGQGPVGIAAANTIGGTLGGESNYGFVYVANQYGSNGSASSGTVSVISPYTTSVVDTLTGFNGPIAVAAGPSTGYVFVSNYDGDPGSIDVIFTDVSDENPTFSTSEWSGMPSGEESPYNIAAGPALSGNTQSDSVWFQAYNDTSDSGVGLNYISGTTSAQAVEWLTLNTDADSGLAADPVTGNIWGITSQGQLGFVQEASCNCTSYNSNYFTTYSLNGTDAGGARIALPPSVNGASSGNYAYISFEDQNAVYVVQMYNSDGALAPSLVATIGGFNSPQGLAFANAGQAVFVANYGNNTVSQINTDSTSAYFNQIVSSYTLPSGSGPAGVACADGTGQCYVTGNGSGQVYIFNSL
jgi:hypothetical protein